MIIRKLTHDDLMSVNKLWSVCYLFESNLEERKKEIDEKAHTPYGYGAFLESGEMISAVLGNELTMNFCGQDMTLCGIGGVVTDPCHRHSGAVKAIMATILKEQYASGTIFSGLYPFNFGFYRKFGYELSAVNRMVTLPLHELRAYRSGNSMKMLLPEDDRSFLIPVFEAFRRRYALSIDRRPEQLHARLKPDPYSGNTYLYVIYDGDTPCAYVYFDKKTENDKNILNVTDFAFINSAAFRSMLGAISVFEAEFELMQINLPSDLPIASMVTDPYSVKTKIDSRYMMRVVNSEKALSALNLNDNESFTIEVVDEFLPENSGTWVVTPGKAEKTNALADVTMSIQAFSQMMCGFVSFESATFRSDVTVRNENPALHHVFTEKPSFIGTHY